MVCILSFLENQRFNFRQQLRSQFLPEKWLADVPSLLM